MLLADKRMAIIGAGPVGLTIARLLQQQGITVTVYERDQDAQARIWGGTLDLHVNAGQLAMERAGLLDNYFALAKPIGRKITDQHTNLIMSVPPQHDTPEINRNDLRTMLLNSLEDDTVMWDSKFTGLEVRHGQWLLHFDNKPSATADIVLGANGGMSNARSFVTTTVAEYTGTYIIQGEVSQPAINCPQFVELCDQHILMTAAEGRTFVAHPDNNGALTYNVSFRSPEALNLTDARSYLSDIFSHWHPAYQQLLEATTFFAGLPARKLSLDNPWTVDRPLPVTLLGDAAHLMPPFAGKGVNTGLMDALILSDNLLNGQFTSVRAAIEHYEQQLFVYAREAQRKTAINEIAIHHADFSFGNRFNQS